MIASVMALGLSGAYTGLDLGPENARFTANPAPPHESMSPIFNSNAGTRGDNAYFHTYNDEALSSAARRGELEAVRVLTEAGADINAKTGEALRESIKYGRTDVALYLVAKGATVDQKMIDAAELTESTADLSMSMTTALTSAHNRQRMAHRGIGGL